MKNDATLEEMWKIKKELSAPHLSWEEYAAILYAFQEEERKRGVKFVSYLPETSDNKDQELFVAEEGPSYGTSAPSV